MFLGSFGARVCARDLSPIEPHDFKLKCQAWICTVIVFLDLKPTRVPNPFLCIILEY